LVPAGTVYVLSFSAVSAAAKPPEVGKSECWGGAGGVGGVCCAVNAEEARSVLHISHAAALVGVIKLVPILVYRRSRKIMDSDFRPTVTRAAWQHRYERESKPTALYRLRSWKWLNT
jgi:hypothetical protein